MKRIALLAICLLASCGGGKKTHTVPPPVDDEIEEASPEPEPEPEPEPAPPPPQVFSARAELTAVKGVKLKPVALTFSQTEGAGTSVVSEGSLEGLKPGTYHLAVHEGAECGKNAAKAGAIWSPTASLSLQVSVTRGGAPQVDASDLALMLDGDESVIGRTIALHDDKKGKPGKVVACGAIVSEDESEE